ncbi:MAG TPA: hypothetical protein VKC66_28960 [Xanthobacteraceae bacterium]|nr:hypothetical protein [Xanthobacteraceae bacterium]
MSCREIEEEGPIDSGNVSSGNVSNVVQLQPAAGNAPRSGAPAAGRVPALETLPFQQDAITHDGLDLMKAFFAIDDAAARAALVLLAQRLAQHSTKR